MSEDTQTTQTPTVTITAEKKALAVCWKLLIRIHENEKIAYYFLGTQTLVNCYEAILLSKGFTPDQIQDLHLITPGTFQEKIDQLERQSHPCESVSIRG